MTEITQQAAWMAADDFDTSSDASDGRSSTGPDAFVVGDLGWTHTTQEVLTLLTRKWVVSVIRALLTGPKRHFQLRLAVKGIQPKVLTETLRALEADGLIERAMLDADGAVSIAYWLTDLGQSLVVPLVSLFDWGRAHLDEVHGARLEHRLRAG
jgi:DNA-binding HxlR family transcriptional regulator